jgi:hypothetical protein
METPMASFWELLKPAPPTKAKGAAPKPASAAALRQALTEATAAADSAAALAAELAERRQAFLLAGTDDQLDQVERELAAANRQTDKTEAAVVALQALVQAAEEAERVADLDRVYAEGAGALERGCELYRAYGEMAQQVARLAGEMAASQTVIEQVNRQLRERGDARRVADLDTAARPQVSAVQQFRHPLWQQLVLPAHDRPHDRLWPEHRETVIPPPSPRPPLTGALAPPAKPLAPGHVRWP